MHSRLTVSHTALLKQVWACFVALLVALTLAGCGGGGGPSLSATKDITALSFSTATNKGLIADAVGSVAGNQITITVPYGVSRAALIATFKSTGVAVKIGGVTQVSGSTVNDFSNPLTYTVVAEDGSSKAYTVAVGNALNPADDINSFSIQGVNATMEGTAIAVRLPFGVSRAALIATFAITGASIKVGGVPQVSGVTVNDFSNPVTYIVTAEDGTSKSYTVTVSNALNPADDINAFSIQGSDASMVGAAITVTLPYGVSRNALVATFSITGASVRVGNVLQLSGVTVNDFSNPVTYTVTAQDGTSKSYTVTIANALNPAKAITAFSIGGVSGTVSGLNISVALPIGSNRSSLVANFSTTGASVKVGGTPQNTGVTPNNFSSPVNYTVTAEDGTSAVYTVTIANSIVEEVFVSPSGDDANLGTLAAPFKTLEQARSVVRAQIAAGLPAKGITVWLRGGIYERTATLELTALDSGSATSPVTWRAYGGETVRIIGAKPLSPARFTPVTSSSAVWSRLDASAKGQVLQVDLRAHGISDFGTLLPRGYGKTQNAALELFINGKAQPLGRWPDVDQNTAPYNHGFASIAAVPSDTSFTIDTSRLSRWATAPDAWAHGYFGAYWADDHIAIASINAGKQQITLASKPSFGTMANQPWYAYNLLEEITQPGEWYLDRSSGLLYLWPTAQFSAAEVYASMLSGPLFNLNGASYITLQGLRLESTRAGLVTVTNGSGNTLLQLVLRNAGTSAVTISGGSKHRVAQSHIADSGEDGIIVSGGDRATLVASAHVVEDCEIEGFARFARTYHPAINLSGVGQVVQHNLMHDSSHSAIMFTGNEHRIELNEIRNVLTATSDAGAIYTGRDWGARGNVIKNNFVHHISSIFTEGYGVHGIYLDDAVSGIQVEGNVVYAVSGNAIQHGGGRDDIIINNVLARNGVALATDTRAYDGWKSGSVFWLSGSLLAALKSLNYQAEPWASRYPAAAAIPNDWAVVTANNGNPWLYPQGTVFSRNIGFANTVWINDLTPTQWFQEAKNNIQNEDPLFVNEAVLDLTLKSNSPALALPGFVPIPFKSIGLRAMAMPPALQ